MDDHFADLEGKSLIPEEVKEWIKGRNLAHWPTNRDRKKRRWGAKNPHDISVLQYPI